MRLDFGTAVSHWLDKISFLAQDRPMCQAILVSPWSFYLLNVGSMLCVQYAYLHVVLRPMQVMPCWFPTLSNAVLPNMRLWQLNSTSSSVHPCNQIGSLVHHRLSKTPFKSNTVCIRLNTGQTFTSVFLNKYAQLLTIICSANCTPIRLYMR